MSAAQPISRDAGQIQVATQRASAGTRTYSVNDLAEQALKESRGDAVKATAILEEHAKRDVSVANDLLMPLLRQACYDAIRSVCRRERRDIWTAPNYTKGGNGQRVTQLASRLMDFPLPGGLPLAKAKREDLEHAVAFYGKQAERMAQIREWLFKVAERVDGRKMVKSCLTERQLAELRESVE